MKNIWTGRQKGEKQQRSRWRTVAALVKVTQATVSPSLNKEFFMRRKSRFIWIKPVATKYILQILNLCSQKSPKWGLWKNKYASSIFYISCWIMPALGFWEDDGDLLQVGRCRRHVDCSGSPISLHWIPSFCWVSHIVLCTFHRQKGPLVRGMLFENRENKENVKQTDGKQSDVPGFQ